MSYYSVTIYISNKTALTILNVVFNDNLALFTTYTYTLVHSLMLQQGGFMLELVNIVKTYKTGTLVQDALKNVSVNFRKNEFVSILGQSGSGKTTMLNIIGGLDRYTSGDLIINGRSTKGYSDKDWDSYRNHSIGFIFQSYNLIPHQTVLSNVEMALTLSGVSKSKRRKLAMAALTDVGLSDHVNKRPSQLSGGQMQRVAIARALVNNPEILLADEPTGALDSETSVQIMNLLKEIAKDRLVIMVTHNPELAEKYSTRIINLFDGVIINDSDPYEIDNAEAVSKKKPKKVGMNIFTALNLSLSNLRTKKGRTFLTAFAGSIGIIGIALILSLSSGMQAYILKVQADTLTAYPISIVTETVDLASMQENNPALVIEKNDDEHTDKIYQGGFVGDRLQLQTVQIQKNNLQAFYEYLESSDGHVFKDNTSAIAYDYNLALQIYANKNDEIVQINPSPLYDNNQSTNEIQDMMMSSFGEKPSVFTQMIDNQELLDLQYDIVEGHWPTAYNEVVLKLDSHNQISDMAMYVLNLKDQKDYYEIKEKIENNEDVSSEDYAHVELEYSELLNTTFKLVLNTDYFKANNDVYNDLRSDKAYMQQLLNEGEDLKIVGIVKPSADSVGDIIDGTIGYTSALINHVSEKIEASPIVVQQKLNPDVDVFNNKDFKAQALSQEEILASLNPSQQAYFLSLGDEERSLFLAQYSSVSKSTLEDNLNILGVINKDKPSSINLYLKDFESRDKVIQAIDDYNQMQIDAGHEELTITFTDLVGMMISSMITIIDLITYALIAFVSISLIVSSIMIGIITYISVLERVKEIGILRSIGASKRDITVVFMAETMTIGLISGLIGVGTTLLLNIPINALINSLSGVTSISHLPFTSGAILVSISVFLTMIAGYFPARMASKKDPVDALRSE